MRALSLLAFAGLDLLGNASSLRASENATQTERSPLAVVIDLVATGAKGKSILDLKPADLEVSQEGVVQRVDGLLPGADPGHYALRYYPRSGRAAPVSVRPLRAGLRIAGLDGDFLKPRVEPGLSVLEAELTRLLRSEPSAIPLPLQVAVLHFEAAAEKRHQTIAVETSLGALSGPSDALAAPRLQLLTELKDEHGRLIQRLSVDRVVEGPGGFVRTQRLVWTGHVHLAPGRYAVEAVVRNPTTGAWGTQSAAFAVPAAASPLAMSSVCLLQLADAVVLPSEGDAGDDPLRFGGNALMPSLRLAVPPQTEAVVRFFVVLYPNRASAEPVRLRLELESAGDTVGTAPLALPAPDADGAIRYVGHFPTRTLRQGQFILRLRAQQGEATASEEVPFAASGDQALAPIRIH